MSLPAVWGGGIKWGSFKWGAKSTSGLPVLYVAIDGTLVGEAYQGRFRLGRSDWFEPMSPQTATFSLVGDILVDANASIVVTCGQGALWRGYVDNTVTEYPTGQPTRTTITASDITARLSTVVKAPGQVTTGGGVRQYWFFLVGSITDPLGTFGDLVDVTDGYLNEYAPDLSITVAEGTSTGTLPTLTDWYFDPSPRPKKSILEILNQAELTSNALMALQHDGSILVVPRAPSGLSSVDMVDISSGSSTWRIGRDTLINRWVLERPSADDVAAVLDTSDLVSVATYGERAYEVSDFLCTTASHFGAPFRAAMAHPRYLAQYTLPVGDLSDPWLMLDPLGWVYDGSYIFQAIGVEHEVSVSEWRVTLDLDASQDSLNGSTEPTPA